MLSPKDFDGTVAPYAGVRRGNRLTEAVIFI